MTAPHPGDLQTKLVQRTNQRMTNPWTPRTQLTLPESGRLTFLDAERALWLGDVAMLVTHAGALVPLLELARVEGVNVRTFGR